MNAHKQMECTEERFINDAKFHQINIVIDDQAHRFVRFKREKGSGYWFDLITWPGCLCISGDCGTYVFSRIEDMFEFFRMDDNDFNKRKDQLLNINPSYWGENLQSIGTNVGYLEFDEDVFAERVEEYFETYMSPGIENDDLKAELWNSIEDEVLSQSSNGEYRAYDAVYNFNFTSEDGERFQFTDFFDSGSTERYTFNYLWNLYAIVWGIQKYDEAKSK